MTPSWIQKLESLADELVGDVRTKHWPSSKIIHDTIWGTRSFEGWEVSLIDLPLVQRLRGVHQTSLAYLTFPTALHTRFDHSLGVCSGTKQLAANVLGLQEGESSWNVLTAAALLHDIGHGPFSHLSEDTYASRPELFVGLNHIDTETRDETPSGERVKGEVSGDQVPFPNGAEHEVVGALLLRTEAAKALFVALEEHYQVPLDPGILGEVIAGNGLSDNFAASMLVNGPFDADKIDYLRRDSTFSGVPIALDVDRLVHSLDVLRDPTTGRDKVAVRIQGVVSAEQILFGKATLYATVYHHHKVRAADCLFKGIVERMFARGEDLFGRPFEDPTDLLRLVDADFTRWSSHVGMDQQDEELAHLKKLLADRVLPVRILELSARSIDEASLQELFRFRNPERAESGIVHKELLTIRSDIAERVRSATGDKTVSQGEIWIDLPRTPRLGDGTLITREGSLVQLSEVFPTSKWVDYYKLHRYVGYVLGPRRHVAAVGDAAREVLSERGIDVSSASVATHE